MLKDNNHVVLFGGGTFIDSQLSRNVIQSADAILGVDQGAATAFRLGIVLDAVIGDFDSLSAAIKKKLAKKNVPFITFDKEKDETDAELAVTYAIRMGATKITILGGLHGDRFDHIAATVLLGSVSSVPLYFVYGNQLVFIAKGPTSFSLPGKCGDLLSLIPVKGDVVGITTKHLRYPLQNDQLVFGKSRGVSNIFLENSVSISFRKGHLLVVHTYS